MSDCERKCSLFIYERCSVILQVEALVANLCGLFPFHQAFNDAPDRANTKCVCIFRFYQIRAGLKVPPRVPHKVETSLLHPGGKYIFED